ncbi:MAG: hypothetical protein KatS3mg111_2675 [Pirellulaceae bacterium]|nr:MAG: hypothetical protein KatS3mg111_2675 [Pirellulaceae bacterium]
MEITMVNTGTSLPLPRAATWEVLQRSRNMAVVAVLAQGLASPRSDLRRRALQSLIARDDEASRKEIVRAWSRLNADDRALLQKEAWKYPATIGDVLQHGSFLEKKQAIDMVGELDMVEAIDAVLHYAIKHRHALQAPANRCVLDLCRRWGQRARRGKDMRTPRNQLINALKRQLDDLEFHQNMILVDAWLAVVHWDDSMFRGVVEDEHSPLHSLILDRLRSSTDKEVLQLLAGFLVRPHAPRQAVDIAVARPEVELAIELAEMSEESSMAGTMRHLRSLPPLRCVQDATQVDRRIGEATYRKFWRIVAASTDDVFLVLRGALEMAAIGGESFEQAAAEMLHFGRCCHPDAIVPALQENLLTGDAEARQTLLKLCQWLESESKSLRSAAIRFFERFDFEHLMERMRQWPTQMCQAMAMLTARVDPEAMEKLRRELRNASPQRRFTALLVVQALGWADRLTDELMKMLDDPKLEIRVKAIDLLSAIEYEPLVKLIPELLADTNTDIQDAADRAARRLLMKRSSPPIPSSSDAPGSMTTEGVFP